MSFFTTVFDSGGTDAHFCCPSNDVCVPTTPGQYGYKGHILNLPQGHHQLRQHTTTPTQGLGSPHRPKEGRSTIAPGLQSSSFQNPLHCGG